MHSRIQFQSLMFAKSLATQMNKDGHHHDAHLIEHALTYDLLNYILQETPEFFHYRIQILDTFVQTDALLHLYHEQGHITIENDLFRTHYNSLLSVASYIHHMKYEPALPPTGLIGRKNMFAKETARTPIIELIEERPSPPPGFSAND